MIRAKMLLLCLLLSVACDAQQKNVQFMSFSGVGFVAGNAGIGFAGQTVNGLSLRNWFAGLGFARDNYLYKTWPVFVRLQKTFSLKDNSLYIFADAGGQVSGTKTERKTFSTTTYRPGWYAAAGMGYSVSAGKHTGLFFQLSNTYKALTKTETSNDSGFPWNQTTSYKLGRVGFQVGMVLK